MITTLIDRNAILRAGLRAIFANNFPEMLVLDSESVDSFYKQHRDLQPNVVIFAQQSDTDIKREILKFKNYYKPDAIIVYDAIFDVKVIREYFKIGVVGCLSTKTTVAELIKCIQDVLDGKRFIGQDFQALILTEYFSEQKKPQARHRSILSAREHEIAIYLSDGHKTSWIARELERKPSTISTIKKNIFKKLQINNIIDLRNFVSKT